MGPVPSALEETVALHIRALGLPPPEREYLFALERGRRWRFDFAWPTDRVAVECMGGLWTGGKHARGAGIERDYEKLNTAQLMGWLVLHLSPAQIKSGEGFHWIAEALGRTA